jgi:hypothetical protein
MSAFSAAGGLSEADRGGDYGGGGVNIVIMCKLIATLFVFHLAAIITFGWIIGYFGELIFGFDSIAGELLWPLVLCALLLYGIYTFFKAVVEKFTCKNRKEAEAQDEI